MSVPGATRRGRPLGVVGGQPVPIGSRCWPPREERRSDTREAQSAQSFPGGWSSRAVRCEVHSAQSFPGVCKSCAVHQLNAYRCWSTGEEQKSESNSRAGADVRYRDIRSY